MHFPNVEIVENLDPDNPFASFSQTRINASHRLDNNARKEVSSVIYVPCNGRTLDNMAYDLNILTDLCHTYIESPSRCIISKASGVIYVEHNQMNICLSTLIQIRETEGSPFSAREIFTCGSQVLSALMYIYNPHKRYHGAGPRIPICNITNVSPANIICNDDLTSFSLGSLWLLIPEVAQYVPEARNERSIDKYITNQICCILYKMVTYKDLDPSAGPALIREINPDELKRVFEKSYFAGDNDRWSAKQVLEYMMRVSGLREIDNIEYNSLIELSNAVKHIANIKAGNMEDDINRLQALHISKNEELELIKDQNERLAGEIDNTSQENNQLAIEIQNLEDEATAIQEQIAERLDVLENAKDQGNRLLEILHDNNHIDEAINYDNAPECFAKINEVMQDVINTYNELKATEELPDVVAAGGISERIQQYRANEDENSALFRQHETLRNHLESAKNAGDRLRNMVINDDEEFDNRLLFCCLLCQRERRAIICKGCNTLIFCENCFNALANIGICCPKCNQNNRQSFERVFTA